MKKSPDANDIARIKGVDALRTKIDETPTEKVKGNGRGGGESAHECNRRFTLIPFAEIPLSMESSYLVKGLIPRVGLTVVWGSPKCGKSFWALDLGLHVALGWEYRQRRVAQGQVVYVALEGASGYGARVATFRHEHGIDEGREVPFYLLPTRLDLVTDCDELIKAIRAQLGGSDPVAIAIDTLNRSLRGSESSDDDMAAYIRGCDAIRDAFQCAVIVIHHCGVDDRRPRGHTSLTGACDAQLAVKREASADFTVTVEWLKDGQEGTTLTSRLKMVELGTDRDGDAITSCIVEPVDEARAVAAQPKRAKLPKAAQTALRALQHAIAEMGETAPASGANHIPPGVTVTTVETWRKYAYQRGISTGEERARQQAFKRASEHLIGAREVIMWDPYVWTRS